MVHKTKKTYKLYYTRDDPHSRPDRTVSEAETIKINRSSNVRASQAREKNKLKTAP